MQFDLKRKQEEEYDLMIEMGGLSLSEDRREPVDDEIRSSSCDANNKPDPDELKRLEDEAIAAKKAKAQKKKDKKVLSLLDLRNDKSIVLSNELLQKILDEAPLIINMWSRVASCIIGLPEKRE